MLVFAFIRTQKKKANLVNIRFRLRDKGVQLFHKSDITVNPLHWDSSLQSVKKNIVMDTQLKLHIAMQVTERKQIIIQIYSNRSPTEVITSEWLNKKIDERLHPEKYREKYDDSFFGTFKNFIETQKISENRRKHFSVVYRAVKRFEMIKNIAGIFELTFNNFDEVFLREFEAFLHKEPDYFALYPEVYKAVPESRRPIIRGRNTVIGMLHKLRTFSRWCVENGKCETSPFNKYTIESEVYGTPYYLTIEERNKILKTNLSRHPSLAVQRDIFVFQCLVGCRVGDLLKMRGDSVIDGAVEYIPAKTIEERATTVRVPLNATARAILDRYPVRAGDKLLPFITPQRYNDAIKRIFLAAGLNRLVTIINPTTRKEEKVVLWSVAASHIARRTFVGNLYKKVKDPNLVGALSGHAEGSRAFARYREIDEEIKTELVNMLE